jgi:hypothetical protein
VRRAEEGGYDTWGVVLPTGKIREFSTQAKATTFIKRMEGQSVMTAGGGWETWTGLKLVHRHIPEWTEVTP